MSFKSDINLITNGCVCTIINSFRVCLNAPHPLNISSIYVTVAVCSCVISMSWQLAVGAAIFKVVAAYMVAVGRRSLISAIVQRGERLLLMIVNYLGSITVKI